jgi:NAD(P)-dependent dehydrogenase (short-subunit alcohol dehydrogenase family)
MDLELTSKRAIVTGGRRGIGRAIAAALAAEGAHVVIASRDADGLAKTAQELRNSTGGTVEAHVVDTTSADSVAALVDDTVAALGGIDILVNNATTVIAGPTSTLDSTPEAVAAGFDDKVLSYLRVARAVLPHMIDQRWGRIISVGGQSSLYVGSLASTIRNSAVRTLSKNIADENGGLGITANTVQPGPTVTERLHQRLDGQTEDERAETLSKMAERVSLRRLVTAEEVAAVVAFLASPRSVAINGSTIDVGGGTLGVIFP